MIEQQVTCKTRKCDDQITIPVKLVRKGNRVIDIARCPRCNKSYKFYLPIEEIDQWMPIIAPRFFLCDVCGAPNDDNWKYKDVDTFYGPDLNYPRILHYWEPIDVDMSFLKIPRIKIVWKCKNCGKHRAKIISSTLWNDLTKQSAKHPSVPSTPTLQCPHCGVEIPQDTKVCPNCKIEIFCSKCGFLIKPGANFCMNCGDSVEKVEVSTSSDLVKKYICPTCEEEYKNGSLFCTVCGQELVCDKCGAAIREGALFCVNCGDVVTKGELSE